MKIPETLQQSSALKLLNIVNVFPLHDHILRSLLKGTGF